MSIQAAYDNWSATYDADENLTRDLDQTVTKETLMSLRCKSVVEIGCGTGKNTLLLSQIALKVCAIDFSAQMIEKAKEKVRSANVVFITEDITKQWTCQKRQGSREQGAGGKIGRSLYSDQSRTREEGRGLIPMFRSASRLRDRDCSPCSLPPAPPPLRS
ncbi:MAG: class I SAM-dependent DNA methyltransferase [Nostoc sp.]